MARKRGRPPKTPSSSNKKSPGAEKGPAASSSIELNLSDEEALEDIDSLTPKKAAELLHSIDLLRQRVQSKIPAVQQNDINEGVEAKKQQEVQTEKEDKTTH
ncbi:hypothetical protein RIF29_00753 [Crotalaria pallida]|uniref:Uncharacterized protein n=1 Tax=Crotalaria pallida TaxID=3830 RepID=A0AAN9IX24_CROPI